MGLKSNGILFEMIHKTVEPDTLFEEYVLDNGGLQALKAQEPQEKIVRLPIDDFFQPTVKVSIRRIKPEALKNLKESVLQECEKAWTKEVYERFAEPLEYDEIGICIDPFCFIVFALIWNGRCRTAVEELLPNDAVYYEYYGKSRYSGPVFERHFRAEDIWTARRLLGMLEKIRAQEEPGEEGKLLMKMVYAGYRYLKRAIRNLPGLDGTEIRDMLWKDTRNFNGMETAARMVLAVLIAEDLDIPFEWDYEWLVMSMFLEEYEEEFVDWSGEEDDDGGEVGDGEEDDDGEEEDDCAETDDGEEEDGEETGDGTADDSESGDSAEEDSEAAEAERERKTEASLQHFLAEFCREYGTASCLSELLQHPAHECWENTLTEVLRMFHISERIFYGHGLTPEEVQKLLHIEEEWSEESFWVMLATAQLCKYVSELTEKYLQCSSENGRLWEHLSDREKETLQLANRQQKQEIERLQKEKHAVNKSLCAVEQQIAALQKQLKETQSREQAQKQELAELRSFAFGLSRKSETGTEKGQKREQFAEWKNRKVIVVGGHANWQGKLREMFPGWQFVGSNQKSVSPDCLRGKKFIVCNTELLTHACYYKILAVRSREQKILYVHSNNMERCMQEMERQLE